MKNFNIDKLFREDYDHIYKVMNDGVANRFLKRVIVPVLYTEKDAINFARQSINMFIHKTLVDILTTGKAESNTYDSNDMFKVDTDITIKNIEYEDLDREGIFVVCNKNVANYYVKRLYPNLKVKINNEWPDNTITLLPEDDYIGTIYFGINPTYADITINPDSCKPIDNSLRTTIKLDSFDCDKIYAESHFIIKFICCGYDYDMAKVLKIDFNKYMAELMLGVK